MTPLERIDLIAAASGVALLASIILLLRGAGSQVPGCGTGSGCDAVTSSRWAKIGPLPVALPATLVYAGILVCALTIRFSPHLAHMLLVVRTLSGLGVLAAGAAIWFLFLQLVILRRFCFYCVLAHVGALAAGALIAPDVLPRHRWDDPPALGTVVGLAALVLLISIQLIVRPRMHRIAPPEEVIEEPVHLESPAIVSAPEPELVAEPDPATIADPQTPPPPQVPAPRPPPPIARPSRQITLLGGRLHFDAAIFPLFGPPDARHVVAVMMDYSCEFCRALHPMLEEATQAFAGELATLMILSPLEPACNPLVEEFEPKHVNACAYARLALAVAHVDEAQFAKFHRWLFEGERPPAIEAAERHAAELLGERTLHEAMAHPRAKQRLSDALSIYRLTGKGPLPRILLPTGMLMGQVSDSAYLISLLRKELDKGPAPPPAAPMRAPARANPFSDRPIS